MALLRRSSTPPAASAVPHGQEAACQFESRLLPGRAGHRAGFKCSAKLRPHLNRQPHTARGAQLSPPTASSNIVPQRPASTGAVVLPPTPRQHAVAYPAKPKLVNNAELLPAVPHPSGTSPRPCDSKRPWPSVSLPPPRPPELRGGAVRPARHHERLPGGSARGMGFRATQAAICGATAAPSAGVSRWSDSKVVYTELVAAINGSSIPSLLRSTEQVAAMGMLHWPEYTAASARLSSLQDLQQQLEELLCSTEVSKIERTLYDVDVLHVGRSDVASVSAWPSVVAVERRLHALHGAKAELALAARGTSTVELEKALQLAKSLGVADWPEVCDAEFHLEMLHREAARRAEAAVLELAAEMEETSSGFEADIALSDEVDELLAAAMIAELADRESEEGETIDGCIAAQGIAPQLSSSSADRIPDGHEASAEVESLSEAAAVELELARALAPSQLLPGDSQSVGSRDVDKTFLLVCEAVMSSLDENACSGSMERSRPQVANSAVADLAVDVDILMDEARRESASHVSYGSDGATSRLETSEAITFSMLDGGIAALGLGSRPDISFASEGKTSQIMGSTDAGDSNIAEANGSLAVDMAETAGSRLRICDASLAGAVLVGSDGDESNVAAANAFLAVNRAVAAAGLGSKPSDNSQASQCCPSQVFSGADGNEGDLAAADAALAVERAMAAAAAGRQASLVFEASDVGFGETMNAANVQSKTSCTGHVAEGADAGVLTVAAAASGFSCDIVAESAASGVQDDTASSLVAVAVRDVLDAIPPVRLSVGDNGCSAVADDGRSASSAEAENQAAAVVLGVMQGCDLGEAAPSKECLVSRLSEGSISVLGLVSEGSDIAGSITDDAAVQFAMDRVMDLATGESQRSCSLQEAAPSKECIASRLSEGSISILGLVSEGSDIAGSTTFAMDRVMNSATGGPQRSGTLREAAPSKESLVSRLSEGSMSVLEFVSEGSGVAGSITDDAAVQFAMDRVINSATGGSQLSCNHHMSASSGEETCNLATASAASDGAAAMILGSAYASGGADGDDATSPDAAPHAQTLCADDTPRTGTDTISGLADGRIRITSEDCTSKTSVSGLPNNAENAGDARESGAVSATSSISVSEFFASTSEATTKQRESLAVEAKAYLGIDRARSQGSLAMKRSGSTASVQSTSSQKGRTTVDRDASLQRSTSHAEVPAWPAATGASCAILSSPSAVESMTAIANDALARVMATNTRSPVADANAHDWMAAEIQKCTGRALQAEASSPTGSAGPGNVFTTAIADALVCDAIAGTLSDFACRGAGV